MWLFWVLHLIYRDPEISCVPRTYRAHTQRGRMVFLDNSENPMHYQGTNICHANGPLRVGVRSCRPPRTPELRIISSVKRNYAPNRREPDDPLYSTLLRCLATV